MSFESKITQKENNIITSFQISSQIIMHDELALKMRIKILFKVFFQSLRLYGKVNP